MSMPRLPEWLPAERLAAIFAVTPATLELYWQRATLGSTVAANGQRLFDTAEAATLFRRRGAAPAPVVEGSLGRLGEIALG
jgi:hypothetical protein